ncbi:hypothetical protein NKOR_01835 [Candidatus Nitrosopumilus koreensis AR1]|uniref:Uncharacterized protein n=1 Tax=Candidatus Nitrosopumilus koreensis AR1 TaxID=1229908 RepID=K0B2L6_9ARCH|nr:MULTISPECIES: hypothetical protein [Nitrosopumilus]AFS80273.1 hypothetical protein NKOR_01835 [Candidatus Nitrosopumilus koreensis AR1]
MSTTLAWSQNETRQLEPQKILVESMPVKESKKLSVNSSLLGSIRDCTWEDLRGLTFTFEDE